MSQVIVTDDDLRQKRAKSKVQEQNIDSSNFTKKWRKATDATKLSPFAAILGILLLPLIGFWALILFLISICVAGFVGVLRVLGMLFAGSTRK